MKCSCFIQSIQEKEKKKREQPSNTVQIEEEQTLVVVVEFNILCLLQNFKFIIKYNPPKYI